MNVAKPKKDRADSNKRLTWWSEKLHCVLQGATLAEDETDEPKTALCHQPRKSGLILRTVPSTAFLKGNLGPQVSENAITEGTWYSGTRLCMRLRLCTPETYHPTFLLSAQVLCHSMTPGTGKHAFVFLHVPGD